LKVIMRSLGLDIGEKRIGVALSDPGGILASPLTIINHSDDKTDIEAILEIISQNQVAKIIVGLPLSMSGKVGKQAEQVKIFTQELCRYTDIPVELRDERLSTVSARRMMREGSSKRAGKKPKYDAAAAAIILQGYLDEAR
jgi:putative Holliday junction resolvase